MPAEAQMPGIVAAVRQRLDEASKQGVPLQVVSEKLDDGWLYVVATPAQPGQSASDHARHFAIEWEIRKQGPTPPAAAHAGGLTGPKRPPRHNPVPGRIHAGEIGWTCRETIGHQAFPWRDLIIVFS
jgi:hypothetical protein